MRGKSGVPRYDYRCTCCAEEVELVHTIPECAIPRVCKKCGGTLERVVSLVHVEGSSVYPFKFWNVRLPDGKFSTEVTNKYEHRKILEGRNLASPAITTHGKSHRCA